MKLRLSIILTTLTVGMVQMLSADELLKFNFNNGGVNIPETTPWTKTTTFDAQLRAFGAGSSGLVNGPGLSTLSNADIWGGYAIMKPSLTEAIASNHYVTFTVQAAPTKALNLHEGSVKMITRSGNTGNNPPKFVALLSSVNGFTADKVISVANWSNGATATLTITGPEYENLTGPVEFRLYIFRDDTLATSSAGFRLASSSNDYISLNGEIDTEITLINPSILEATPVSLTQINLAWPDPNDSETAYIVERSPNGTAGWTVIATLPPNSVSHSDTGLLESTVYFYRVKAITTSGQSAWSPVATATTLGNPPDGASGLSATAVNGTKAILNWLDHAINETGFKIERSTAGGNYELIASVAANATSYTDRTLHPGTSYSYRVIATNTVGDSSPSPAASVTTPLNSTVNFLAFGNSYSHFYEFLPSIAGSMGDTVNWVVMRNGGEIHIQLKAEQDAEDGLRTLPSSGTEPEDGFSPLETNYNQYVRMKTILDQREWDVIAFQPHSSYANKYEQIVTRANGVKAYFSQPHHEPSAEVVFYHTTQYRNDEHLFRNLINGSVHTGKLRGNLPYTEDQHVFDALVAANSVNSNFGYRVVSGGLVQENLRYDPRWGIDFPDLSFDYFNDRAPKEPVEYTQRRLQYGFGWNSSGSANNPKFSWSIDSHPHVLLNYLTACLWYETLFRKDVRLATYKPTNIDQETAAIVREVAHRTYKGEMPPLRLTDQPSRTQYADILWARANELIESSDPEENDAGYRNLITLRAYFPEHAQAAAAEAILDSVDALDIALELAAKEAHERPIRESIYQQIWDSSTSGKPITVDLSLDGDLDGDGLNARFELAFGLNPFAIDQAPTPEIGSKTIDGASWITITHNREKVRTSRFVISVEKSQDLINWTQVAPSADFVTTVVNPNADQTTLLETVERRIKVTSENNQVFLRLSVTAP